MKALFLGNVAADRANGIKTELPHSLRVEILAEPQDLSRAPGVSADADILVTNHWRAEYPPAPRVRLVQSVATGIELIDLAALPRGADLQCLWPWNGDRGIRTDGNACLEPSLPRDRGRFSCPFVVAVELGAERPPLGEVLGSTVGIIGHGRVGREVARQSRGLHFGGLRTVPRADRRLLAR